MARRRGSRRWRRRIVRAWPLLRFGVRLMLFGRAEVGASILARRSPGLRRPARDESVIGIGCGEASQYGAVRRDTGQHWRGCALGIVHRRSRARRDRGPAAATELRLGPNALV